ncbi:MAG: type II toxin-antitoxin system VapC family toxin [Nitrospirales bacterium]
MNRPFLVDSDVFIDYLKGFDLACDLIETHIDRIGLSVITIAEIRAGIKGKEEEKALDQFLSAISLYDVTRTIAEIGGDWVQQFGRSHSVEVPDALIAATAAEHHLELKTLNTKHYPMFKNLQPAYKKKKL